MSVGTLGLAVQQRAPPVAYKGNDKLLLGIVLGVIAVWLFAQTTLNVNPSMRKDLAIEANWMNIIDNGDIAQVHYQTRL